MPELTRRLSTDAREECWHVYYGDVHAGTIAIRTGIPPDEDPIMLPDGRKLVTLRDAAAYATKLPKKEAATPEWQAYVARLNIQVRSLAEEYGVATVEPEEALIG